MLANSRPCHTHGWKYVEGCAECVILCGYQPRTLADIGTQGKIAVPLSALTPPPTPARKDDAGKPDMTLITYSMLEPIVKVLEHGAKVYGRLNYRSSGEDFDDRLVAAVLRHMLKYTGGEDIDVDSGEPHLSHAAAGLLLLFDRRAYRASTNTKKNS